MSSLLTLALSGGAMPPNIARLFGRPLERVVRAHYFTAGRFFEAMKLVPQLA